MTDIHNDVMNHVVVSVAGCTLNAHKRNEEIRKLNIRNVNEITVGYKCTLYINTAISAHYISIPL